MVLSWFVCVCVASPEFGSRVAALIQQVMEMNERMRQSEEAAEQARQLLQAHRTAGQMQEERMNRTEASVTGTSPADWRMPGRAQVPEAPGADGAFAARYQPESFSGEDIGWRDWSRVFRTWAGRSQPGDEATVTELDLRLDDLGSAEMKSVAAAFYRALILFCKGDALKIVLTKQEGEGFEAWRPPVNKYEPTSKASVVGKLAEMLRTPFDGDLLNAITTFERKIKIYEAQSRETSVIP